eukprot:TRINITY_DN5903_c0_g4_i1.p1 TRINITY_DN5903_c0_g4~~TRINITY_DN5903_c0_g4_i1.p1  ORF type:complete len:611 (+),score=129.02 TRINITY_DN5903_c0_g4_i1:66-1835(+)
MSSEGDDRIRSGDYAAALQLYSKALEARPLDAALWLRRSLAQRQLGRFGAAEKDAARALELQPASAKACGSRVLCLMRLGRLQDALSACREGLRQSPNASALKRLRSELGRWSLRRQRQLREAPTDEQLAASKKRSRSPAASDHASACQPLRIRKLSPALDTADAGDTGTYDPEAAAAKLEGVKMESGEREAFPVLDMPRRRRALPASGDHRPRAAPTVQAATLRRGRFTRRASVIWRLCASSATSSATRRPPLRRPPTCCDALQEPEQWRRFTPSVILEERCMARVWNGGKGGQCSKRHRRAAGCAAAGADADFCWQHSGTGWQVHGRVDGPIPSAKLREFLRCRLRLQRQQPQEQPPPQKQTLESAQHSGASASVFSGPKVRGEGDFEGSEARVKCEVSEATRLQPRLQRSSAASTLMPAAEEYLSAEELVCRGTKRCGKQPGLPSMLAIATTGSVQRPRGKRQKVSAAKISGAHMGAGGTAAVVATPAPPQARGSAEVDLKKANGHVGSYVQVRGDGWGGGGGFYVGVVTEVDARTFSIVMATGVSPWTETIVLREHCTVLREDAAAIRAPSARQVCGAAFRSASD